jgi:hypothetical protein
MLAHLHSVRAGRRVSTMVTAITMTVMSMIMSVVVFAAGIMLRS